MAKRDRANMLRASLSSEQTSLDARFAAADAAMSAQASGLLKPPAVEARIEDKPASREIHVGKDEQGRAIVRAPLELVDSNIYNARHKYKEEIIRERAASLARDGQKVPAAAVRHPDKPGRFMLVDGEYRKRGLQLNRASHIDLLLEVIQSRFDLYRLSRLYNKEREDETALDDALSWQRLLDDGEVGSQDELAERLGIKKATVTKTMALLKLPGRARELVEEMPEKFGVAIGYELYLIAQKLNDEDRLVKIMQEVIERDLSSRALEQLRSQLELGVTRKPKESSRQYQIKSGEQKVGVLKEWESGKVTLDVHLPDPKARAKLVEELRERFGLVD